MAEIQLQKTNLDKNNHLEIFRKLPVNSSVLNVLSKALPYLFARYNMSRASASNTNSSNVGSRSISESYSTSENPDRTRIM